MNAEDSSSPNGVSSTERHLLARVDPHKVYYLRFILEAHGHLGWLTTKKGGLVIIHTSEANLPEVLAMLRAIGPEIGLQEKTLQISTTSPENSSSKR
ncbi:MAG: DUF4911 domain-containing protein [Thermodesulfobacteria bacterium]|nr:DUF4911 domain-containing protein [Thermodesulfobacteriota bacterium]